VFSVWSVPRDYKRTVRRCDKVVTKHRTVVAEGGESSLEMKARQDISLAAAEELNGVKSLKLAVAE
jgi:hypothetical protein